jgi:hypothetical protein
LNYINPASTQTGGSVRVAPGKGSLRSATRTTHLSEPITDSVRKISKWVEWLVGIQINLICAA